MIDIKKEQLIATKIIDNAINYDKLSHAYLVNSNGYSGKMEFAKHIAKKILCKNNINGEECNNCKNCLRIDNNVHTEVKIIESDGSWIKKEQLESLQREFTKKSLEGTYKIYIINDCDKLNLSSSNSILKFLEEPENGIIAILITDNIYQVINTIRSRCQIINLLNVKSDDIALKNKYYYIATNMAYEKNKIEKIVQDEMFISKVDFIEKFIYKYETEKRNILLDIYNSWNIFFSDKEKVYEGLEFLILYYKMLLDINFKKINFNLNGVENIKISNVILAKKIKILLNKKIQLKFNINTQLLMDKLILEFLEVENGKSSKGSI